MPCFTRGTFAHIGILLRHTSARNTYVLANMRKYVPAFVYATKSALMVAIISSFDAILKNASFSFLERSQRRNHHLI